MRTRIILDNGGGITIQLSAWAHHYDSEHGEARAAEDVLAWLLEGDTSQWDGHEDDALACEPTHEEIRNGGYKIVTIDRETDTPASLAAELRATGGAAARLMADALDPAVADDDE